MTLRRVTFSAFFCLLVLLVTASGRAQDPPPRGELRLEFPTASTAPPETEKTLQGAEAPELEAAPPLGDLAGKPIRRIEVRTLGGRWPSSPRVTRVRVGEALTAETARRAVRELLETGGFARAWVEAVADGDGAALIVRALPRRLIATIRVSGAAIDVADTLEAVDLEEGGEITPETLEQLPTRIRGHYTNHGFAAAQVGIDTTDTDDPSKIVLSITITPGEPRTISQRVFVINPAIDREVGDLKENYRLESGDRVDEPALAEADRDLTAELRRAGFYRADVRHAVRHVGRYSYLYVYVDAGSRIVPVFDGNRAFDGDDLKEALSLAKGDEGKPQELAQRLRAYYLVRGFLDAEITAELRGKPTDAVQFLAFTIRENRQVRVTHRVFPCLTVLGREDALARRELPLSPDDVGEEIESFLEEDLPGAGIVGAVDPRVVNQLFGPGIAGGRAAPVDLNPAMTYAPETYDRAIKHVRDLLHSKGYLNALVGPIGVVRATCKRNSPPGQCIPEPFPPPRAGCRVDAQNLPIPEPEVPEELTCRPDPKHGIECSAEITLRIPIQLGPQTTLYDLAFEGNKAFAEKLLAETTELELGAPLSSVELEAARLRLLDRYRDDGHAYADVRTTIDPSPDRTRARVRFSITEREPVVITDFVVVGATRTDTDLILGRVALKKGERYRQAQIRRSEERIATLGTFSSVTIGLEDPDVPQRNKRVVITVAEQLPQYLDPRIGFSTGEGLRFGFEYGHRNIGGQAISLTLRVQLGYLFEFIILDEDVLENHKTLTGTERLERRNSATITFPEIGLGPTVSLSLDGIDVNDNQRDFRITKQAFIPAVSFRPRRQISAQLSGSVEYNDVAIFQGDSVEDAIRDNPALASLLRVPDGKTIAIAQRLSVQWDRRDNPLSATKGTLVAGGLEHVNAFPAGSEDESTIQSHFLRISGKVAGYIRLSAKGMALAVSLSGGYNVQLDPDSKTYPDRLFFMGGVDSIRSFNSDELVPEDIAQRILHPENDPPGQQLTIDDVAIRGGDLALNPRIELRIPLNDTFQLGLFLDAGNLWVDPAAVDFFALRFGPGAGLRIATPIGPLALDYGINVIRRPWEEDLGAFHFSIGLF